MESMRKSILAGGGLAGLIIITLILQGCAGGGSKGQKQTEKLTSTIADFSKSVGKGRADIEQTLAAYDLIVNNEGGDLRKPYNQFSNGLKALEEEKVRIGKIVDRMKVEADVFFTSWEANNDNFTSPEMKQRATDRLNETKARYDAIHEAGKAAGDAYDPFITILRDQHTYLSSDLNATAAASLKKDAARIQRTSTGVYDKIDAVIAAADAYTASVAMKVEPPPACACACACAAGCGAEDACGCGG